jgi:hypothetical protein
MIYRREGMRHQCWSLVIVSTERGRQVGDEVLHHGLPRSNMELGSYFLFLQEQIKDIIIIGWRARFVRPQCVYLIKRLLSEIVIKESRVRSTRTFPAH